MMYKAAFSVLLLLILAACGQEAKKTGPKAVALKIEPFLAPVVEKVTGGEGLNGARGEARDLIVNYNKAVVEAQIAIDKVERLKPFTTKHEYTRMFASLEKDRTEGRIMSCTLKELIFKDIRLEKGVGWINTSEEWYFEDRELNTGKKLSRLKDMNYEVSYKVTRANNRWVIDGIEINKASEYFPPRGTPARVSALPHNNVAKGGGR